MNFNFDEYTSDTEEREKIEERDEIDYQHYLREMKTDEMPGVYYPHPEKHEKAMLKAFECSLKGNTAFNLNEVKRANRHFRHWQTWLAIASKYAPRGS